MDSLRTVWALVGRVSRVLGAPATDEFLLERRRASASTFWRMPSTWDSDEEEEEEDSESSSECEYGSYCDSDSDNEESFVVLY